MFGCAEMICLAKRWQTGESGDAAGAVIISVRVTSVYTTHKTEEHESHSDTQLTFYLKRVNYPSLCFRNDVCQSEVKERFYGNREEGTGVCVSFSDAV